MEYLKLGIIIGTHGLDGTLKIKSSTMFQEKRYQKGNKVFLYDSKNDLRKDIAVISYRSSGELDYLKLEGIDNINDAESYKGMEIHALKDSSILDSNSYYFSDIVGCAIIDENNRNLGNVIAVEEFPAQITLRCKTADNKGFFVPFISSFIRNVDIAKKEIHINYMEGML